MKRIKDTRHAIKLFEELVYKINQAISDGSGKRANQNIAKIHQIVFYLKERQAVPELAILLEHPNAYVRYYAATYLLPIYEKQSLKVLKEIVKKQEVNTPCTESEYLIKMWKNGECTEYIRSLVL